MKTSRDYSESERVQYLEQWKESGMGLPAFSLHSGIPLTSLRYWVYGGSKKNKRRTVHSASFLPVQITEAQDTPLEVLLELPGKVRLTIRGSVSAEYLKSLFR